jgi:hypothetical protein
VNWRYCFRYLPTETVTQLAFGRQEITRDMLFNQDGRFRFIKFVQHEDDHKISECERDIQLETQHLFERGMERLFAEKLEADPMFIVNFLNLCTGSEFIPDIDAHPEYKIVVEFNSSETQAHHLPVVHTCVNLLKIPAMAYDGDMEIFEEKLKITMKHAGGIFDMA